MTPVFVVVKGMICVMMSNVLNVANVIDYSFSMSRGIMRVTELVR